MFYLNEFVKLLKYYPIRFIIFIFLTFIIALLFIQKGLVEKEIRKRFSEEIKTPHFFSLLPEKSKNKILERKLNDLPGIEKIQLVKVDQIDKKMKGLISELDLNKKIFGTKFIGLKIFFEKRLSIKGQNLIKKYLSRFVGRYNIVIGETISEKNYVKKKEESDRRVGRIFWIFNIFPITILWIVSFRFLSKNIKKRSYLIENYQRKKNVHLKTLLAGMLSLFLVSIFVLMNFGAVNYANSILVFLFFILSSFLLNLEKIKIWS
jgi:hypothetical protein